MSPLAIQALASYATAYQPFTTLWGGIIVEGHQRASVGATLGVRVYPGARRLRASAAAVMIAFPYTAYGASAGVGSCHPLAGSAKLCFDLEGTAFVGGTDLPEDRVAVQAQALVGVAFDVF